MDRLTKIAVAGLAAMALGFSLAACQPQLPSMPEVSAETVGTMTVAEVQELVTGNTVVGVDAKRNIKAAEYFAPDGTAKLKANTPFGTFNYDGTYFFNDLGHFCTNYPAIPIGPKEFCKFVTPLGDGQYEQSDGIVLEQVLEGERLDALE
ncbi:MAG: hypothetical protein OXI57_02010 [Rhodospirillales bacterium]|nr:hypothetical protein [Rhodospirillales bacterium]